MATADGDDCDAGGGGGGGCAGGGNAYGGGDDEGGAAGNDDGEGGTENGAGMDVGVVDAVAAVAPAVIVFAGDFLRPLLRLRRLRQPLLLYVLRTIIILVAVVLVIVLVG